MYLIAGICVARFFGLLLQLEAASSVHVGELGKELRKDAEQDVEPDG